jgi:hypothetical protein
MSVIPALRRLRQEDHKFKTSFNYIWSSRPAWTTYETLLQKKRKNVIPLTIALKKHTHTHTHKHINLTKHAQDLYAENYKMLRN